FISCFYFLPFNTTSPPVSISFSLHDALPIYEQVVGVEPPEAALRPGAVKRDHRAVACRRDVVIALQKGPDAEKFRVPERRDVRRSEEHTSELQSREKVVCRLLLEKKKFST